MFANPDVSNIIFPAPTCDCASIPKVTFPVEFGPIFKDFFDEDEIFRGPSTLIDTSTFAVLSVVFTIETGVISESFTARNLGICGSIIRSSATFIRSSAEPNLEPEYATAIRRTSPLNCGTFNETVTTPSPFVFLIPLQ